MVQKYKITVLKIKISLDRYKIRSETARDKINELRDGSIKSKMKHRVWDMGEEWRKHKIHKRNVGLIKRSNVCEWNFRRI